MMPLLRSPKGSTAPRSCWRWQARESRRCRRIGHDSFETHLHAEAGFSDDDIVNPEHNPDIRAIIDDGRRHAHRFAGFRLRRGNAGDTALSGRDAVAGHLRLHDCLSPRGIGSCWPAGSSRIGRTGTRTRNAVRELDRVLPHVGRALRLRSEIARCQTLQASPALRAGRSFRGRRDRRSGVARPPCQCGGGGDVRGA